MPHAPVEPSPSPVTHCLCPHSTGSRTSTCHSGSALCSRSLGPPTRLPHVYAPCSPMSGLPIPLAEGKQPALCPGSPNCGHFAPAHTSCDQQLALLDHGHDSMPSLRRAPQPGTGWHGGRRTGLLWPTNSLSPGRQASPDPRFPFLSLPALPRASAYPDQTDCTTSQASVKSSRGPVS